MKLTYDEWFKQVDAAVKAKTGLSVHDLEDCCLKDWWQDGKTAKAAASKAIRYSMSN